MKLIPRLTKKTMWMFFGSRYRLARWTRRSRLFNRAVSRLMFEGDEMVVIPKEGTAKPRTVEMNLDFEQGGQSTVLPADIVKRLIDKSDDIFIMNFCICRRSNKCSDFPTDHGCIFLGKGTRKIPPEFGHFATREETKAYVDECSNLGLVQIIGRNKLDSIWLSTGKKTELMTVCNCCPCCCLWNFVRDVSGEIAGSYRRMEGVEIAIDTEKCLGCGQCQDICFTRAAKIAEGRCTIDQALCRGCGRCADVCPGGAIAVTYDAACVEKEVARISSLFDL